MQFNKILNYLNSIEKLPAEDIENITKALHIMKYKKNEDLISNHSICDKIFFITKGVLRIFCVNEKGLEKTHLIAVENQFCTNWASFINLSQNNTIIQSLENTEVIYMYQQDFFKLVESSSSFQKIYIKLLEDFQVYQTKRFEFVQSLDIKERLTLFNENFPLLKNRLTNKVLASFLLITPEHCSSLKKNIL